MYLGKSVVFEHNWLYSSKSGCIRKKMLVFGQRCCIRAEVVVIEQKWLYLGKIGCIRAKVVVFEQSGFIRLK